MRPLMTVVALVMGIAVYAALPAAAQGADEKAAVGLAERIQDLNLTDEQEAKIADIRKEYKPKVREAAKDLTGIVKEEVEKVRDVLTPEQRKKLEEAKEERKELRAERLTERIAHLEELDLTDGEVAKFTEIRKEFRPKIEKAMKGLEGLLSDEQKKDREEGLKAGKSRKEILASLKLTDEQKEKAEAVGKEVRALLREEMEKMRDVLSDGQKEKLQEFKDERKEQVRDRMAHRVANLKDLDLTDEQKTKIADIRKEYRPKVQEAGNKLRDTVREEVEAILAVIKG
jgi:Spy/CpxP family protein refolding chaperone